MLIYLHFVSLLTSPWAEVSKGEVVQAYRVGGYFNKPTEWHFDERVKGGVHFAETEESFLLSQMQPKRACRQLVLCPLPELMCRLASNRPPKDCFSV